METRVFLIIGASGTVRSEIVKQQDAGAGSLMKQVEVRDPRKNMIMRVFN